MPVDPPPSLIVFLTHYSSISSASNIQPGLASWSCGRAFNIGPLSGLRRAMPRQNHWGRRKFGIRVKYARACPVKNQWRWVIGVREDHREPSFQMYLRAEVVLRPRTSSYLVTYVDDLSDCWVWSYVGWIEWRGCHGLFWASGCSLIYLR